MCSARPAEEGPVRVARGNVTNINFFGDCFRCQNAHEHTQASRRGRERGQRNDRGAVPRLGEKPSAASSCTASSVSAHGILHKSEMPPHARARMRGSPSVQTQYILTNGYFNSSHDVLAASLFPVVLPALEVILQVTRLGMKAHLVERARGNGEKASDSQPAN